MAKKAPSEKTVKELKARLYGIAKKRWPESKERQNMYVFGILRKMGWKPNK